MENSNILQKSQSKGKRICCIKTNKKKSDKSL